MSTKAAEEYDHIKSKNYETCKMCAGQFVPGGFKTPIPKGVCIWCATRGRLHSRYMMMWTGLQSIRQTHDDECRCTGCKIYLAALPIMEPSASIESSRTTSPEGQEGSTNNVVLS